MIRQGCPSMYVFIQGLEPFNNSQITRQLLCSLKSHKVSLLAVSSWHSTMFMTHFSLYLLLNLFLLVSLSAQFQPLPLYASPYLSPTTTIPNYQKMIKNFKVFIYKPNKSFNFGTSADSLFYTSLRKSPFVTQNAEEAHLYFVPFSPDISRRSLTRFIGRLRVELPYWNRTLGADHFFLSCSAIGHESDRNLVELRKNSIQISCFPARNGKFIPHKDVTLPPLTNPHVPHAPANQTATFLAYARHNAVKSSSLVNELINDPEFLIESGSFNLLTYAERLSSSKFCLFEYWNDVSYIGEALRYGCVPVVIADHPVNDLPFMDVLRWPEIAVFVKGGGGAKKLKKVLNSMGSDRHENMRGLGVVASKHFVWNEPPQPFDSFNTVMYQLWLRRHTIRYASVE